MNNLEQQIARQKPRQLPREWRAEILATATLGAPAESGEVPSSAGEPGVLRLLREVLWPAPAAWGAIAAVWLVIVSLRLATPAPMENAAGRASPVRRTLAEMVAARDAQLASVAGGDGFLSESSTKPAATPGRRAGQPPGWIVL